MDPLARNVAERPVDHALAFEPGDAGKSRAFDDDGEMGFAAAVVPGMAVVSGGVVDHLQPGGGEGGGEQLGDFLGKWSGHIFSSSASFPM